MVECQLPKLKVASSILVARSNSLLNNPFQFALDGAISTRHSAYRPGWC